MQNARHITINNRSLSAHTQSCQSKKNEDIIYEECLTQFKSHPHSPLFFWTQNITSSPTTISDCADYGISKDPLKHNDISSLFRLLFL